MSILDKILGKSQMLKSKKHAVPKSRHLGFEGLENREMLSVSTAEFASIRSQYADLNLSTNMADYNVIEIKANELTDAKIREAITAAAATTKKDLIVLRTTATQNTITLGGSALAINIDASKFGSVTIVSLGTEALTIDANKKSGVLSISDTSNIGIGGLTITGGNATSSGGGIHIIRSTLTLTNSTIAGNTANNWGGGIYNLSGKLTLTNSAIEGNNAKNFDGGGIYTDNGIGSNSATLTLVNSVVAGNNAKTNGGGIYTGSSTVTLINSAVVGNTAASGGGAYTSNIGSLTLVNSTIAGNNANTSCGGIYYAGGALTLNNTIVARNIRGDITDTLWGTGAISGNNNLIGNGSGLFQLSGTNNIIGTTTDQVDPQFVSFAFGTWSKDLWKSWDLRLAAASPAVDKGSNGLAVDASGKTLQYDLDGKARIQGGTVDIGAYEYVAAAPDLQAYAFGSLSSSVVKGERFSVTGVTIKNIGNAASGAHRLTFYASTNSSTLFTSGINLGYVDMKSLAAGATDSGNYDIGSASLNAGSSYYIGWRISGVSGETVTSNNTAVGSTLLVVKQAVVPTVPASPATASAVSATGNVTKISWSKVDGATSYDIMGYNKAGNYWWKIGTTNSTSYNAQSYSADVTMIAVHAVNSAGRSTGKTASIFRAPTTVSAIAASGNQTKISWNVVAGATSYEILGYNKAGNYWWKIGTTNKTSYDAPGYTANVTTIAVHAIRGSDRTGGAATSIFRAPAGVSVVAASATQTKITWNAVAGATSYDIMGYNKAGNYWWKIGTTNKTSYDAPAYSTNVTTVAVHAIRDSDRTAGTTAPVVRAPSNVTATSLSSTSIRFSWNAVAGATRYELAIYNSVTKKWSTLTSVTQNTYTATGLPVGVTQVSVHALNAAGRTAGATATVR